MMKLRNRTELKAPKVCTEHAGIHTYHLLIYKELLDHIDPSLNLGQPKILQLQPNSSPRQTIRSPKSRENLTARLENMAFSLTLFKA